MESAKAKKDQPLIEIAEFDQGTRGIKYRETNERFPEVRVLEFLNMLKRINPGQGDVIVEAGTGNGFLTIPLATAVNEQGKIITIDNSITNLEYTFNKVAKLGLKNIEAILLGTNRISLHRLPIPRNFADKVVSLATFHHYGNKKLQALKEYYRILKPGGRIIIGDIAHNTDLQYFFDRFIDNHCSTGHNFPYLDKQTIEELSTRANLKLISYQLEYVPWLFVNEQQMTTFLQSFFDLGCSSDEVLKATKNFLGTNIIDDKIALNWQLCFVIIEKPIE